MITEITPMKVKDNQLREEKLKKSSSKLDEESSSSAAESESTSDNQQSSKPMITEITSPSSKPIATTNISMKHKQTEVKPPSVPLPKKKDKEKEKSAAKADQIPSPPKKEKIKAYEYDKWDKFDVEEECSKLDEAADSESSGDEIDEEMENARLKQQALAERERGNTFFKQGKYDKAIERYTAGIQIDPYCPLLPANRAMAFLKENKFGAAEQDCSLSLSLDHTYIKALQRRMTARIGLKKYHEALMDCEKILQIEPANKQAREEELVLKDKVAAAARYAAAHNNTAEAAKGISEVEEEAVKKEVFEKTQKLNLKDNMKSMFAPVKDKPAVERLEPLSDVSPGLLLQSSPSDESSEKKVRFAAEKSPWPTPDPSLVIHPVSKPPHQRSKKPMKKITIQDQEPKTIKPTQTSIKPTRMKIIEVDGDENEVDTTPVPMDTSSQDLPVVIPADERFVELPSGDDNNVSLKNVDFSNKYQKETKKSGNAQKLPESNKKITEIAQDTEKKEFKMDVDEDKSADNVVTENLAENNDVMEKSIDGFPSKSRGLCRKVEKEINNALQEKEENFKESENDVEVPGVPKT